MTNPVIESTRFLVENPRYVFINEEKLEELTRELKQKRLTIPTWDFPPYPAQGEFEEPDLIDYFLLANSINFAFSDFITKKKFITEYDGRNYRGATGMFACLKNAIEQGVPLFEGEFLKNITDQQVSKIFQGNPPMPMLKERAQILREVGKVLTEKYQGRFYNIIKYASGKMFNNGEGIVERLVTDFPSFDDSAIYIDADGETYYPKFYKRAQLALMMLYGRFNNNGRKLLEDQTNLLASPADYIVPAVLRARGVLEYSPELAGDVDNERIIPSRSLPEMEIRASDIHARQRTGIPVLPLDAKLWFEYHKAKDYAPHHLTPTTDY